MKSSFGDGDDDMYEIESRPPIRKMPSSAAKPGLEFSGGINFRSILSKFETDQSQVTPKLSIHTPKTKSETQSRYLNSKAETTTDAVKIETRSPKTEDLDRNASAETRNMKTGTGVATLGKSTKGPATVKFPPLPPPFERHKTGSPVNRPCPTLVRIEPVTGRRYRLLRLLPLPPDTRPPKKPNKTFQLRRLTFDNFIR